MRWLDGITDAMAMSLSMLRSLFLILYLKLGENFDPNCFVPSYEIKLGFPGDSMINSLRANGGDAQDSGSIPVLGRYPAGGNDNLLQ